MVLIDNLSIYELSEYFTKQNNWDFFISCGSFEERCKRGCEILKIKKAKIQNSIIFNYKETDPEKRKEKNIEEMVRMLKRVSDKVDVFNTESVSKPSEGLKDFLKFLSTNKLDLGIKNIAVDITVFTKPYFFLLFKILEEKFRVKQCDVIYTEPEKYRKKDSRENKIILTEGLDRIESIPGFYGSSSKNHEALIVVLGFEGERSQQIFDTVNPCQTYAVNGFPSFKHGWDKISLEENLHFLQESGASTHLFSAPAIDPFETRKVVFNIVKEIRQRDHEMNCVIAPLGTKMQALGVLLYALQDKSIKVVYPFPSIYKTDYSYKYGQTIIVRINFDQLREKQK